MQAAIDEGRQIRGEAQGIGIDASMERRAVWRTKCFAMLESIYSDDTGGFKFGYAAPGRVRSPFNPKGTVQEFQEDIGKEITALTALMESLEHYEAPAEQLERAVPARLATTQRVPDPGPSKNCGQPPNSGYQQGVPRKGLEPLRTYMHRALNTACLPIPPPRRDGSDMIARLLTP